jgi:hypothetical protein
VRAAAYIASISEACVGTYPAGTRYCGRMIPTMDTDLNPASGDWAVPQKAFTALNRYGRVDEVAALVAFIAGPDCWGRKRHVVTHRFLDERLGDYPQTEVATHTSGSQTTRPCERYNPLRCCRHEVVV